MSRFRFLGVVAAVSAVVMSASCVSSESGGEGESGLRSESSFGVDSPPAVDVSQLPTAEEETARLRAVIEQMAAEMEALSPVGPWKWLGADDPLPCARVPSGKPWDVSSASLVSTTNVPAGDWDAVFTRMTAIAGEAGIELSGGFHNEAGNRDLRGYAPDGRSVRIGDGGRMNLSFHTGCRRSETGWIPDLPPPPGQEPE